MSAPTARQVTRAAAFKLSGLTATADGLAWLERGAGADSRTRVVAWTEQTGAQVRTPPGLDVGSALHGYGGGVYALAGPRCYAVRSSDSVVVVIGADGELHPLPGTTGHHYADLVVADAGLLAVRESSGPQAQDCIVLLADGSETVLVRDDFLSAPTPGPNRMLAWLRWSRDQMPWDATELRVAAWRGDRVEQSRPVAGGPAESVVEPQWGPDGALYFLSDRSGWWNLYRWDGADTTPVAPMDVDCAAAPWEAGYREYAFLPGGRIGLIERHGSRDVPAVRLPDGQCQPITLPYTSLRPHIAARGDRLAVIASSPSTGPHVVLVDPDRPGAVEVIARGPDPEIPLSTPDRLALPAADGSTLRVLLYPPTGLASAGAAPLIVCPHPGPTDNMRERADWRIQFFTAHGYAVASVDYRGSTGYGRAFRESLYGHWGEYDVQDCRAVAEYLIEQGRAVADRVFISGQSAGAYTALKAVCDPATPFAAAVAAMSIVDPHRWQHTAARFQRAHALRLAGPAGAVRAAEVSRPVLLMHGSRDTIAPVGEVVELADGLVGLGKPHRLIVFDGAGHGFADAHAEAALDAELDLYRQFS